MKKPNNYDATAISGDFTPIELGGHYLTIKQVKEQQSRSGKDMIVVAFDFSTTDRQAGYFIEQFKKDIRPEKKWPHAGTKYIMVEDANGNCSKTFKTFIASVERSNAPFKVKWGEDFTSQFAGKTVGGVFGEVENEYNGKTSMRRELRWFCGADKVGDASIPDPVYLNGSAPAPAQKKSADFMAVPDGDDEEIPFL